MKNVIGKTIGEGAESFRVLSQSLRTLEIVTDDGDEGFLYCEEYQKEIEMCGGEELEPELILIGKIVKDTNTESVSEFVSEFGGEMLLYKVIDQHIGKTEDVFLEYGYDKSGNYVFNRNEEYCPGEGWVDIECFYKDFKEVK